MFVSLVSSLWPATIPIFYAFGPRLNVIEDLCRKAWNHIRFTMQQCPSLTQRFKTNTADLDIALYYYVTPPDHAHMETAITAQG